MPDLPQHNSERIAYNELVESNRKLKKNKLTIAFFSGQFSFQHLRGRPINGTDRVGLLTCLLGVFLELGNTKVRNTGIPLVIQEDIVGLEIMVDSRRVGLVEEIHSLCCLGG